MSSTSRPKLLSVKLVPPTAHGDAWTFRRRIEHQAVRVGRGERFRRVFSDAVSWARKRGGGAWGAITRSWPSSSEQAVEESRGWAGFDAVVGDDDEPGFPEQREPWWSLRRRVPRASDLEEGHELQLMRGVNVFHEWREKPHHCVSHLRSSKQQNGTLEMIFRMCEQRSRVNSGQAGLGGTHSTRCCDTNYGDPSNPKKRFRGKKQVAAQIAPAPTPQRPHAAPNLQLHEGPLAHPNPQRWRPKYPSP